MLVITKDGHADPDAATRSPASCSCESAHPVPDVRSLAAAPSSKRACATCAKDVFPLFLISGGSSSLVEALRDGVSLDELLRAQRARARQRLGHRHAERRSARACRASRAAASRGCSRERRALALFISDVPGDDPDVIGSGLLGRDAGVADGIERHVIAANVDTAVHAVRGRGARARPRRSKRARAVRRRCGRGGGRASRAHCAPATAMGWCGAANPR